MKVALNVVALLAILGAAFLSYNNYSKVQTEQDSREIVQQEADNLKRSVSEKNDELAQANKALEEAQNAKAEVVARIENLQSDRSRKEREAATVQTAVDRQVEELEGLQKIKTELESKFGGEVSMEELPAQIQALQDQVNEGQKRLADLEVAIEGARAKAEESRQESSRLKIAIDERAARIRSNERESTVLGSNSDLNYVYFSNAGNFSAGEQLIVKRGGRYVGKVKVTRVEAGGVIADVVNKSMARGARIRPGDRVIREKALTQ